MRLVAKVGTPDTVPVGVVQTKAIHAVCLEFICTITQHTGDFGGGVGGECVVGRFDFDGVDGGGGGFVWHDDGMTNLRAGVGGRSSGPGVGWVVRLAWVEETEACECNDAAAAGAECRHVAAAQWASRVESRYGFGQRVGSGLKDGGTGGAVGGAVAVAAWAAAACAGVGGVVHAGVAGSLRAGWGESGPPGLRFRLDVLSCLETTTATRWGGGWGCGSLGRSAGWTGQSAVAVADHRGIVVREVDELGASIGRHKPHLFGEDVRERLEQIAVGEVVRTTEVHAPSGESVDDAADAGFRLIVAVRGR